MKHYYFEPFDLIVFPIIPWLYRFQRPQQISVGLARKGHRVFYLHTNFLKDIKPWYLSIRNDPAIIEVHLGGSLDRDPYTDQLDDASIEILLGQFSFLQEDYQISKAICLVDLPFWGPLALGLQKRYGWKVIYDCLDHFSGFTNLSQTMLESEGELAEKSDLILATSHNLFNEKTHLNPNCLLVPNGTDFNHFNFSPETVVNELVDIRKPIIGYYGAINHWFDTGLVYDLAQARADWSFVLIGDTEGADLSQIKKASNVHLFGEKPYELIPGYLQYFDTCIIPFRNIPLTNATNPVKLFEYLSAGKSIVATDLNELRYYQEHVRLASSVEEWLAAIELALWDYLPGKVEARIRFARQNTWDDRISEIEDAIQLIYQNQMDRSAPLPLILPKDRLVSSKLLTHQNNIDYWCLVYEKDDIVYKQASRNLAEREGRFLSRLKSKYFPRLLNVRIEDNYSVITYKRIKGQNLHDSSPRIRSSATALYDFIQHGLNILTDLEDKGIMHRNICRENIVVQNGRPVLLDLGWAVTEQEAFFAPAGLGGPERPRDGGFSDIYSMGRILEYVNQHRYQIFDWMISLMTAEDPSMRVTDLKILKILFANALAIAEQEYE